MNPYTGELMHVPVDPAALEEVEAKLNQEGKPPLREWVQFTIGEEIEVKGIKFHVHDVSDQRLVLKFVGRKGV